MTKSLRILFYIILLQTAFSSYAQVVVTFPGERAVFQRNNANEANVYIAGFVTRYFQRIEARFVPRVANEGAPAPADGGWATIDTDISNGQFYGSLPVKGGWYRLEVRGIANGIDPVTAGVERVGVGEVFVVAGQSNATGGDDNPNGAGAVHDQVNSVDFQNLEGGSIAPYSNVQLPCPTYVQLGADVKTAPFGNYAWCWGSFGDKLYEKLRVPVMIFNSGWSSTSVTDWKNSIDPNAVATSAFGYQFPAGLPFGHLRLAINYYLAQLGVRAVLWHQGETDNLVEKSQEDYRTQLMEVINASRSLTGKNDLAWLVARASRYTIINEGSRTWPNVINAQNELISNDAAYSHIYEGPDTDPYFSIEYRRDQIHFRGDGITANPDGQVYSGLVFLAQLWVDKITNGFLSQSRPYEAIAPPVVTTTFNAATSETTLTAPAGATKYNWLTTNECKDAANSNQSWTVGPGNYKLRFTDTNGNVVYSPQLYVSGSSLPVVWKTFTAKMNDRGRASLEWSTSAETNNERFEIQRSIDADSFHTIKTLEGAGNSVNVNQYAYEDEFLPAGIYYYRLRQVDFNGDDDYTRILGVKIQHKNRISIYPNPVVDNLNITSDKPVGTVTISDQSGKNIFETTSTSTKTDIDMSQFANGLYIIRVGGEVMKILK